MNSDSLIYFVFSFQVIELIHSIQSCIDSNLNEDIGSISTRREYYEQDCIDSLRQDGKWDDVKKQQKQYIRLLKQKKEFTSRYRSEEERIAYGETV